MDVFEALQFLLILFGDYIKTFVELIVPPGRKSITSQNVLITGGGHGIGRELALEIAKLDTTVTVVVWDINKEGCEQTVAEIKKTGGKAFAYECDITNTSKIRDVATRMRAQVGEINILINNAGILNGAPLMDLDEVGIRRTFEVNTLAHFWMVREFLPFMMSKNHGHIVNICSMASFTGTAHMTDYSASKFAAYGFADALIDELNLQGFTGITVSCVCPMFVDTGLVQQIKKCKVCKTLTANEVALAAIDGMLRGNEVITVPSHFWLSNKIGHLIPRKTVKFLKRSSDLDIKPQYKKQD